MVQLNLNLTFTPCDTQVSGQISHATHKLHARKSLEYTFTRVSLQSSLINLSGHSRVATDEEHTRILENNYWHNKPQYNHVGK